MNGLLTLCDFANIYNKFNDKKSVNNIYKEMIEPLLDKEILLKTRETKKKYNNDDHNFVLQFNPRFIDDNPIKSSELKILKK